MGVVLDLRVRRIGIEMMSVIATVAGSLPTQGHVMTADLQTAENISLEHK